MSDERKTLAKLEYAIDQSGEIYIDIAIDDYSEETVKNFGLLLASIPTPSFEIQTLKLVQEAFTQEEKLEELKFLISEVLAKKASFGLDITEEIETDSEKGGENDPLIQPTDLI